MIFLSVALCLSACLSSLSLARISESTNPRAAFIFQGSGVEVGEEFGEEGLVFGCAQTQSHS